MHTISAKKENGFKVEVFDWNGKIAHSAFYQDRGEAQDAAHHWERLVTMGLVDGDQTPTIDEILSDDELLRELGA